jgi:hypothetical protein
MITITLDTNQKSHLQRFIRLAERLQIAINVSNLDQVIGEDWGDWDDVDDVEFSKFAISQIADDWDCPEEWAELSKQTVL